MTAAKSYDVSPRWHLIVAAVPVVVVAGILMLALLSASLGQTHLLVRYKWYLTLALVAAIVTVRPYFALAHRVVVHADRITFHRWRTEAIVRRGSGISLRPTPAIHGGFQLVFDDGRVTFSSRFTGFHEVVAALKSQSPKLIVEGC